MNVNESPCWTCKHGKLKKIGTYISQIVCKDKKKSEGLYHLYVTDTNDFLRCSNYERDNTKVLESL